LRGIAFAERRKMKPENHKVDYAEKKEMYTNKQEIILEGGIK
jgi:hypothetical protein